MGLLHVSQSKKHQDQEAQRQRTPPLNPLLLPEILDHVFSYLNQHTLKSAVRFVCKQWLASARPRIHLQALWKDRIGEKYNHPFLLARLHQVTTLRVLFEQYWIVNNTQYAWQELKETVDSLRLAGRLRINTLVLVRAKFLDTKIYHLLPKLTTLTAIRIDRAVTPTIHLGVMLALCPNLRMLTVDPGDNQPDIEDNTDPCWPGTVDDAGQPKESRIRKLVLKGVKVEQSSLERILSRCPHLRTLKLIGLLQGQTGLFDRVQFFTTLSTSCSLLESFHLSFHDSCMTIGDTSALIQTFFPTIGSMGRDDEGIQETPRQQTHKFTTMSLYHEDFNQDVYRQLLHLYNYPYYIPNTLTSLEILCSSSPVNSIFVSNKIHDFLCSAPTLLHLIAPQVQFFSEHLDLNGTAVKNEPEYLYPRLCKRGRPVSQFHWVRRKMWACRGLRTLQLKFVAMEADYPSAENARIMFGYIARACPELRDLAIERKALDLTYKGGMCLLARLRHLERLTILTYTRVKLEKKDLEWMGREPAKRFTLPWRKRKPKTSQPQSYTITRGNRNVGSDDNSVSSGGTSENELWTLDDMKQVGTTAELDACQKEIAERGCWPKLMFLGLQHAPMGRGRPIKVEEYLTELAYDIRPDIQFSCDSKQWWD